MDDGVNRGQGALAGVVSEAGVRLLVVVTLAVLAAAGCSDRHTGGLDAIRERGELRVVVRPGFLSAPARPGGEGDQRTQLLHLAARLGVELRWVEAEVNDELIELLVSGRADLAVSRFSPAVLVDTGSVATVPVEWVEDLLIAGPELAGTSAEDIRGVPVHVQISRLTPSVRHELEELGLEIFPEPEERTFEDLLTALAAGEFALTVTDSGLLERAPEAGALRIVLPVERRPVVWAVREANLQLRRAIDDFLFAEQVLARPSPARACRDLPQIRAARVLRLVTRNSPTTCFVSRGGLEGFEYELAVAFARQKRLRLELSIPPPGIDPLDWLERGFGDIAALHEPVEPSRAGRFRVSETYRKVDFRVVLPGRSNPAITFEDLAGRTVTASRPAAEMLREFPLDPPIVANRPPPGVDGFSAMQEVAKGRRTAAVVDEDAIRLGFEGRTDLVAGPRALADVPLVWVLNASSPVLHREVNAFLREARSSGLVSQLTHKNLGTWQQFVSPRLPEVPDGHLTPYDEYLTWAARQYGIDWRLLASLMYEESRFDPDAVGPGGSAGLFQFMPFTWRELGVEDPHHPGEAIEAGARYLRSLMDKFDDLDLPDRVAMAIASYNVGPRHVFDARRLAADMGFDPDRWLGNVETAMYILDDPEVARRFPAGVCRCRRGAAYTRRILRRYAAYTEQFPPS
jgi:membrane-bound lytic murein transglycosylase F